MEGSKTLCSPSKFPQTSERNSLKFIENFGTRPQKVLTSLHQITGPEGIRCYDSSKTSKLVALCHSITSQRPDSPILNVYEHFYLHFTSLILFMPNSQCGSRYRAHKEAHNITSNEQSDSSHFTVSLHTEENN